MQILRNKNSEEIAKDVKKQNQQFLKRSPREQSKRVWKLVRGVCSPHCQSKSIVSRWTHRLPGSLNSRYKIPLKRIPSLSVCEAAFKLKHALSCPKSEFMSIKHNKVGEFMAELLSECCNNLSRACVTTTSR